MNLKPIVLLLGLLPLCAGAKGVEPPAPAQELPAAAVSGLDERLLYQFMLAEIAGQRGQLKLATDAYLDLAQRTRDARLARRATEVALYANQRPQAMQAAKLWLELEPEDAKARQTWVALLISAGRLDEARPHLQKILALDPAKVGPAFLQLHGLLARHGDKAQVLVLMEGLAKDYPAVPEAQFAVAQAALGAERHDRAEQASEAALRLRPDWDAVVLFKGQVLKRHGNEAMLAYWREHLGRYPEAREVRSAYAGQLARLGQYEAARVEFERLLKASGPNAEVHAAIGLIALQVEDIEAARSYLARALELGHPDAAQIRVYLGQLSERQGRLEEALDWYRSVEKGPRWLAAQLQSALVLGKLKRLPEARALLQGLAPSVPAERLQVVQVEAQLLREAGDDKGVYEVFSRALEAQPDSPELLYDHAMAAERTGRIDVLERNLRRLIQLKPDHAHAYNALGYTLADRTKRLAEALELVQKALALAPDDPFIQDSMGWTLFKLGRMKESAEYLRRAYAARPDPEIAAHLGEVLWASSQKDEARRIWQGALKAHPDNELLRETVSRLKP